jgi:hypothetical protein
MWKAFVFFGLIANLIIAAQGDSRAAAGEPRIRLTESTDDSMLLEEKAFTDSKSGISARLPKGWVSKKGIEHTGYEAPAKDRTSAGGLAPNVIFAEDDTPGVKPTDLAAVVKLKVAQFAKLYADSAYKETINEKLSIGDKEGQVIGFRYTYKNVLPIEVKQVWVVTAGKIYTVTFTSLEPNWEKNNAVFEAITKTLKIP